MTDEQIILAVNAWRIEDGKGVPINDWQREGCNGRFPIWAWENRFGRVWRDDIEMFVGNFYASITVI